MTTAIVKVVKHRTTPEVRPADYTAPVSASVWTPSPLKVRRFPDWTIRLDRFLIDNYANPHKWGTFDCALMVADAIQAMTGVDIASDFRGQYTDQPASLEAIKRITGGTTVEDAAIFCADKHGLKGLEFPLMAQRGDLVVLEDSGRVIAGLVHLSGRHVVASGEAGLKRILIHDGDTSPVLRAWRV